MKETNEQYQEGLKIGKIGKIASLDNYIKSDKFLLDGVDKKYESILNCATSESQITLTSIDRGSDASAIRMFLLGYSNGRAKKIANDATDKYHKSVGLVSKSYKLDSQLVDDFKCACKNTNISQAQAITQFMNEFVAKNK